MYRRGVVAVSMPCVAAARALLLPLMIGVEAVLSAWRSDASTPPVADEATRRNIDFDANFDGQID